MTTPLSLMTIRKATFIQYSVTRILLILVPLWALLVLTTMAGGADVSTTGWLGTAAVITVSLTVAISWPIMYANTLRYCLDGSTLRIEEGVLLRKQKSIPLDRVTDLELVQGPLMRLFGLWKVNVQTAGSSQQSPEGVLHGLAEPQQTRDVIMEVRDRAARTATDPG